MLGTIMFISKLMMEWVPNIHFLGMLMMTYTLVYRKRALIPLYVFVLLEGVYAGFNLWWVPYLYIWTILWAVTMILPRNMPKAVATVVYMVVCSLHGFLYGILYAPAQALFFGLDFKGTISWIISGIPFDAIHGVSNLLCGLLIVPLISVLKMAERASDKA